jgi:GntR family transcriptional regulator / MocR family aminotransferase
MTNLRRMKVTNSHADRGAEDTAAVLLTLTLDRSTGATLNRQLYMLIRELILSGRLVGGARLPSTRQLALDLRVSRTVTLTAYDQLVAEGYIEPRRGSGQYVCDFDVRTANRPTFTETYPSPTSLHPGPTARGKPFDPTVPAWTLFPTHVWSRLIARSWRREGSDAIGIDHWGGLPSLRAAVAGHLRAMQGLDCSAEQVIITGGNDDALQLIVRGLDLVSEAAWVEDPGHVGARRTLGNLGVAFCGIPVDVEGIDVDAGRRIAPNARMALVTPSRQFPLGMPMSLSRRLALIDWARTSGAVIIEDDYDSEIRFSGRPMASLSGLDADGAVVAIGSFSKLTFPGLRLGYGVGPPHIIARLIVERARQGVPVASSAQPALAAFMAEGGFSKHLGVLRRTIAHRRAVLIDALSTCLGSRVVILPQEVGMHLTVLLNGTEKAPGTDVQVATLAGECGLSVEPLSKNSIGADRRQGFLLGYAAWEDDDLVQAVQTLATLMDAVDIGTLR